MATDTYLLGTDPIELERLRLQHELWLPEARQAWQRAALKPGERVLDLGAGPGFVAMELAREVGPAGRVLGLELSAAYAEAARAAAAGLSQLEVRQHDLCRDPFPREPFDLVWCRWVAMFLGDLDPLLDGLGTNLEPGARVIFHEYIHWSSFGLHPGAPAVASFGRAAKASFRAAGGDPDVNRRLPSLLSERGFHVDELRPLSVVGRLGDGVARWLERFVTVYGPELIRQGLWTEAEAEGAQTEMVQARQDPGAFWVGPTVMETRATR
ncbi:methyltransferase domain-containing protein [Synechococcus sp. BA-124 BA4]|uniref:methyltransferase domain-containing protein n=1 Tax=unclassified Synechococcus TaxID=2626047 RepID=UPI0018CFEC8E|nr:MULTISPECIES: methyltransferase domain-containing protein [unclassified Synechococcus]MEA5400699.1 methyltransferase domain-containing protein [Synechococcus sp. BA-124 BA4]QPN57794.1 methyltransferase domain-containing protein [Synechococcus sp. CBW1107]CAK6687369.1 2-phytyl-1,4-beta-naphthoquinone methyltransferase, chloroplastic [Synechococcus sp. CBW1107]